MTDTEVETLMAKWKETKKPSKIAGSFNKVSDLEEKHIEHFRGNTYLFKPMNGNIFGGMCMDDSLDYIHMVLLSEEVVNFILNLKPQKSLTE